MFNNLDVEAKKEMSKDISLSVFKMFGKFFELGCEIKVDRDGECITIAGYDNLEEEYGLDDGCGKDNPLRERTYSINFKENESGQWESDNFTEVVDCIQKDSAMLGIIPF